MYPSPDGSNKAVVVFTTESDKPYDTILGPNTELFDVVVRIISAIVN